MKRIVLKYRTELPGGVAKIPVGPSSRILDIQVQQNFITFWVEHDSEEIQTSERRFVAVPTGVEFEAEGLGFLRTVQAGSFVWHIYEKIW